jgi:hypothetical protein
MAYNVNKTDGTLLTTVVDGTVDNTSADISLVGRKFSNYGEVLNENLIKILESFANTTAPDNPLEGQVWYDKLEGRLKVYTGTTFKPTGGPLVEESQPQGLVKGDLWMDSLNNQLYFYDGVDLGLAGPIYTSAQGKHGWIVETLVDSNDNGRAVTKLFVNDLLVGILSRFAFTPKTAITGFASIKVGLNFSTNVTGLKLHGTAASADTIAGIDPGNFLRADIASTSQAQLSIQNDAGLVIGGEQDLNIEVIGDTTVLKNNLQNKDFKIQVNSQTNGGIIDALEIDADIMKVNIFKDKTASEVEIGGSLVVQQNLTVNGITTFVDSQNLRVADRNIELGFASGSETDVTADGGGLTLKGDSDHTFAWSRTDEAWESSESISLEAGREFRIAQNNIINTTTIGPSVVNSNLQNVGVLTELQVDDIDINGTTISTRDTNGNLNFNIHGTGNIVLDPEEASPVTQIKGVQDPTDAQDVGTKNYIDSEIRTRTLFMTINTTGIADKTSAVDGLPFIMNTLAPASNFDNGATARVLAEDLTLAGAQTNINVTSIPTGTTNTLLIGQTAVDQNGVQNSASVLSSVAFPDGITLSGSALGVVRSYHLLTVSGGTWTYTQAL